MAVGVVVGVVGVIAGVKSTSDGSAVVRRTGWTLVLVTILQVLLGIGAFVTTRLMGDLAQPGPLDVAFTTAHQAMGAVVLGTSVVLLLWRERLACATPS